MSEFNFLQQYDQTLRYLEEAIDEQGEELDYENQAGMLTIFCPNGSQIIVSRQSATEELWLAAKTGGFHFRFENGKWCSTRDDVHLKQRLEEVVLLQSQEKLVFDV